MIPSISEIADIFMHFLGIKHLIEDFLDLKVSLHQCSIVLAVGQVLRLSLNSWPYTQTPEIQVLNNCVSWFPTSEGSAISIRISLFFCFFFITFARSGSSLCNFLNTFSIVLSKLKFLLCSISSWTMSLDRLAYGQLLWCHNHERMDFNEFVGDVTVL